MAPLQFNPEVLAAMAPIKQKLHGLGLKCKLPIDDTELAMEIERHFGIWLIESICKPLGVNEGGCLILALAAAKGEI